MKRKAWFAKGEAPPFPIGNTIWRGDEYHTPNQPVGVSWVDNGTKSFVIEHNSDRIRRRDLDPAYQISSAVSVGFLNTQDSAPHGVDVTYDGKNLYYVGENTDLVYRWTMDTAYDIENADINQGTFDPNNTTIRTVKISSDGFKLITHSPSGYLTVYNLAEKNDITTVTGIHSQSGFWGSSIGGFFFSTDGTLLSLVGLKHLDDRYDCATYVLPAPYIVTPSLAKKVSQVDIQAALGENLDLGATDVAVSEDGLHVVLSSYTLKKYITLELTVPHVFGDFIDAGHNVFLEGMAATILTKDDLPTYFAAQPEEFSGFSNDGTTVKFRVDDIVESEPSVLVVESAFTGSPITSFRTTLTFRDTLFDGGFSGATNLTNFEATRFRSSASTFNGASSLSPANFKVDSIVEIDSYWSNEFWGILDDGTTLDFKGFTELITTQKTSQAFKDLSTITVDFSNLHTLSCTNSEENNRIFFRDFNGTLLLWKCTSLQNSASVGGTVVSRVFGRDEDATTITIEINGVMRTINNGNPHADLQQVIDRGGTVIYTDENGDPFAKPIISLNGNTPYYVNVVENPNKILNYDFQSGLDNWSSRNSVLTVEDFDGKKVVKIVDAGTYSQAYQAIDTEAGVSYYISLDYANQVGSPQDLVIDIYDGDTSPPPESSGDILQISIPNPTNTDHLLRHSRTFVATSTRTTVGLRSNSANFALYTEVVVEKVGGPLGLNMLKNGEFNANINDWSEFGTASTWDNGELQATNDSTFKGPYQVFTTVVGETYEVSGYSSGGTGNRLIRAGSGATPNTGLADSNTLPAGGGFHTLTFTATTTQSYVYLRHFDPDIINWDNIVCNKANQFGLPIPTAIDSYGADITEDIVTTGEVDYYTLGTYNLTYDVTDQYGNSAVPVVQEVIVEEAGKPTITLIDGVNVDLPLGGAVGDELVINGTFDTGIDGWTAGTSAQTVLSWVDGTALRVDSPIPGTWYEERAFRNQVHFDDGDVCVISSDVRIISGGTEIETRNRATQISRIFHPADGVWFKYLDEFDANQYEDIAFMAGYQAGCVFEIDNVSVKRQYVNSGATAVNKNGEDITSDIIVTGTVDFLTAGTYQLQYNVVDEFGIGADTVTQNINVGWARPVITLLDGDTVTLPIGGAYGPEYVENGDFSDGLTGWVLIDPADGTMTLNNGGMKMTTVTGDVRVYQPSTLPPSIVGILEYTVTENNSATLLQTVGTGSYEQIPDEVGTHTLDFTGPTSGHLYFKNYHFPTDITLDNISVKERFPITHTIDGPDRGVFGTKAYNGTFVETNGEITTTATADNDTRALVQSTIEVGKVYKVSGVIGNIDAGTVGVSYNETDGGTNFSFISIGIDVGTDTPFSFEFTATDVNVNIVTKASGLTTGQSYTVESVIIQEKITSSGIGATAVDKDVNNITNDIVVSGTVDYNMAGTYTLYYDVTDSNGLHADTVSQTIIIEP